MQLHQIFRQPALGHVALEALRRKAEAALSQAIGPTRVTRLDTEFSFYIRYQEGHAAYTLTPKQNEALRWLLAETFEPENVGDASFFATPDGAASTFVVEAGPRLSFESAFSTNAVSVMRSVGLPVQRVERYRRYCVTLDCSPGAVGAAAATFGELVHDRMTEMVLAVPLTTFDPGVRPHPVQVVPVLERGRAALEDINKAMGLSLDAADIEYYYALFALDLKRNPTDVELFDISMSNSEHSRHWFFKGKMVLDGETQPATLMQLVQDTLKPRAHNSVVAFSDNSSAIRGFELPVLAAETPGGPSVLSPRTVARSCLLTAETHNAPSAVAPYPGAETGTGGRIRDTHATGRGSHVIAGTTGYAVGHLHIPGYELPWEREFVAAELARGGAGAAAAESKQPFLTGAAAAAAASSGHAGTASGGAGGAAPEAAGLAGGSYTPAERALLYPANVADPLTIEVEASNGASDYGNKFGEPVVAGFTRSVGLHIPVETRAGAGGSAAGGGAVLGGAGASGSSIERREYVKPIMFTAGIGALDDAHAEKGAPERGMVVVKLGGPAYRIGMGGSAASSMMQGENKAELDFNAVQRGDAEMEQKVNRVIRACVELGPRNPIISIHDQGAGGNCNVLKEIVAPAGGRINIRAVPVGDSTMSVLELWVSEYQENDALLIRPADQAAFAALCRRERVPFGFVGEVTGDGRVVVVDETDGSAPVDMDVEKVLGDMPQKTFAAARYASLGRPLALPAALSVPAALDRVLRLLSVGSKRFLTNKVDRSVSGLVAQQQCVGPLHTPLADCAVVALSHFDTRGVASSIGEQPVKGLVNLQAMARMAVGEAVTNLMGAAVTGLGDAKCSANWMWAAKLPHEAAHMYDACKAMADFMLAVGVAVDGGKDSLSMASRAPSGEMVKAPGTLVISLYAACPDITLTLTPDFKAPGASRVVLVDLSAPAASGGAVSASGGGGAPQYRLGGSALAQVFGQVGAPHEVPDCESPATLVAAFEVVQSLLRQPGQAGLLSLHDRSDGGLLIAALEMAFAGNCGVSLDVSALPGHPAAEPAHATASLAPCFAEELGVLLEVRAGPEVDAVLAAFAAAGVRAQVIGVTLATDAVTVTAAASIADPVAGATGVGEVILDTTMTGLRTIWEATSFQLERLQANPACVASEEASLATRRAPPFALSFTPTRTPEALLSRAPASKPAVAVIREEGCNGDREMCAALFSAGFQVLDVHMSDLVAGTFALSEGLRGVVFPGGFSYADVLDSAKGWAGTIRFRAELSGQFDAFYRRSDTFSLGVCNGCQLMALLGWVPFGTHGELGGVRVTEAKQPRFIHNDSGRFESRFSTVRIEASPAIMLRGMAGSVLGVWVAHGEGKAHFPDPRVLEAVKAHGLVPLSYVDDDGIATEAYPFNPNGSPGGIAGLCSADGRHLAVMPHPERVTTLWQWPWMPEAWKGKLEASPWATMFQNARAWCEGEWAV